MAGQYPDELKFTNEHEWVRMEGDIGVVGITHFAQEELGDVVFVELPEVAASFARGDEMGAIESVKAVSALYMPVSGEVVEVNEEVVDRPEIVNEDPHGEGWLVRVKLDDATELDSLLDAAGYQEMIEPTE